MRAFYSKPIPKAFNFAAVDRHVVEALKSLIARFPGRILFATGFTPEDQVIAHLIFTHNLPVRVFTRSGHAQHAMLLYLVERYGQQVELSSCQSNLIAAEFAAQHPASARQWEDSPASAPLHHVLSGRHVLIGGLRKQLAAEEAGIAPLEWDSSQRKFRFHPLYHWTSPQLLAYLQHYDIPYVPGALAEVVPDKTDIRLWAHALRFFFPKRVVAPRPAEVFSFARLGKYPAH